MTLKRSALVVVATHPTRSVLPAQPDHQKSSIKPGNNIADAIAVVQCYVD